MLLHAGPLCRAHAASSLPRLRPWCFTWNRKAVHRSPSERVCSPPFRKRGRVLRSLQEEEVQIGKDARTTPESSCSVAVFRTRRDVPSGPTSATAALPRLLSVPIGGAGRTPILQADTALVSLLQPIDTQKRNRFGLCSGSGRGRER